MKTSAFKGSLGVVALLGVGAGAGAVLGMLNEGKMQRPRKPRARRDRGKQPSIESSHAEMTAALFDDHLHAIDAIKQLAGEGCETSAMSLFMTDRTAERSFSIGARASAAKDQLPRPVAELAAALKPLAPLGTPGSGIVGTGPAIALFERAGFGSERDLGKAIEHCGGDAESAHSITERVKHGGVLIVVDASCAEHSKALSPAACKVRLEGSNTPLAEGGILRAPSAASGSQRASYEPLVQPGGEFGTLRNRELR